MHQAAPIAAPPADGSFVGLDWGNSFHQVCVLDPAGGLAWQGRVGHDVDGLARLDSLLGGLDGPVRIAVERAEGLLVERLQAAYHQLFCVSPKIAARARERYRLANTKNDAFDAFVLAGTLRHEHARWRPLATPSPLLAELRALSRDRDRVLDAQQAVESQLREILLAYHPATTQLFSSLDRDIALAFIRDYPTPQAAAHVGVSRMAAFCRRHGYSGRTDPAVLTERLRAHLLSAAPGTVAAKAFSARHFVDQLALLTGQLSAYDKRLATLLDQHPDAGIFTSFPGIATIIATTMLAEIGEERARFPAPAVLLAEAGAAPVTRSSGRSRQVRFRYAANSRLRHAVDWWAFTSIRESDWARDAYDQARARGHQHHRALRGLGARWLRIFWRCWTDHTPYDPARHLKTGHLETEAATD
jgi:transposase